MSLSAMIAIPFSNLFGFLFASLNSSSRDGGPDELSNHHWRYLHRPQCLVSVQASPDLRPNNWNWAVRPVSTNGCWPGRVQLYSRNSSTSKSIRQSVGGIRQPKLGLWRKWEQQQQQSRSRVASGAGKPTTCYRLGHLGWWWRRRRWRCDALRNNSPSPQHPDGFAAGTPPPFYSTANSPEKRIFPLWRRTRSSTAATK